MSFSEDFIEKVRDASDIVDIIRRDTQLKPTGGGGSQLMGLCPFPDHNESTPSFSVSASKQVYHCFGCQKGGNIYHYLRDMKGMSFPEAVESLASAAGIPIPKDQVQSKASDAEKEVRRQQSRANKVAALFYHESLKGLSEDHPAKKYLATRGFTEEIINEFLLGYSPDSWDSLVKHFQNTQVSARAALQVGLIRQRSKGDGNYDYFRDRLMFPIVSHKDQFVGFGGRVIDPKGSPKYVNSSESPIFHKGSLFYGLHQAAKYIRSNDKAIIVEGYTDYLALFQAGFKCVVATLGTAMTFQHAKLLKRHTKNVYVLFDGDEAGQKAARRSLDILLNEGLFAKGLTLPDKQDPDDFIKSQGVDALQKQLKVAPDLFELVLSRVAKGFSGTASDTIKVMDEITPILLKVSDQRLRDLYVQSVANRLGQDKNWVYTSIRAERSKARPGVESQATEKTAIFEPSPQVPQIWVSAKAQLKGASKVEIELINVALLNQKVLERVIEEKEGLEISHSGVLQTLEIIADRHRQAPEKFDTLTAYLQTQVEPHGLVARHLKKPLSELDPEGARKLMNDCIKRLKADRLRQKQRELARRLTNQQGFSSPEELEQIMNVHKDRHSLNKED